MAQVKAHMVFKQGMTRPQKAVGTHQKDTHMQYPSSPRAMRGAEWLRCMQVWSKCAFLAEWEAVMPCTHPLTDTLLQASHVIHPSPSLSIGQCQRTHKDVAIFGVAQGIALDEPTPSGEASWRYLPAEELDLNPEVSP